MKPVPLAFLLACAAACPAFAASAGGPDAAGPPPPAPARTGKERLGDKGSDEQRVDDCKVPAARRTRDRPAACPWDVGS